jgi:adenylate cyclase
MLSCPMGLLPANRFNACAQKVTVAGAPVSLDARCPAERVSSAPMDQPRANEEFRRVLSGEEPGFERLRVAMKRIPSSPRCKLCAAPFEGAGGALLRHLGFGRFPGNPALCNNCITSFKKRGQMGAEIPVTLLFADVRGSTGIAEGMRPAEFRAFLDHFYTIGADTILQGDGLVDKVVGDEVIGLFFGGVSGPRHSSAALTAAIELLQRAGRDDASPTGPIPIGAGVHTGEAYVGTTGPQGAVEDFTALGDVVNTTARLASTAARGELLVTLAAAEAAGHPINGLERRSLEVRGRHEPVEVIVIRP